MSIGVPFGLGSIKIKFWNKKSVTITDYDPVYKVVYLGNVLTPWAKGEGCVEKPLATLWRNYCSNVKHEIYMKLTICNQGLKAITREHGLTEYWANRVTFCAANPNYPKVFCWIYRHEGRKMKQELRCHAVLCNKEIKAHQMAEILSHRLTTALQEFRREKKIRQNTRLSLAHSCLQVPPAIPVRTQLLVKGLHNFRPPLERSKSAPKLCSIEEIRGAEEEEEDESDEEYPHGCGSINSEGHSTESSSDIVSDDVDSLTEHLSAINANLTIVRCDPNFCDRDYEDCAETGVEVASATSTASSVSSSSSKKRGTLNSISESQGDEDGTEKGKKRDADGDGVRVREAEEDVDQKEKEEDTVSSESGYSETGDTASSTRSPSIRSTNEQQVNVNVNVNVKHNSFTSSSSSSCNKTTIQLTGNDCYSH